MKVFVYGTLKAGCWNNRRLEGATLVKEAVVPGFKLLNAGFPVAKEDAGAFVNGEIWDIGDPSASSDARGILAGLDSLEGYREGNPNSMYIRTPVTSLCGEHVEMYVGGRNWDSRTMDECPSDENRYYTWSR